MLKRAIVCTIIIITSLMAGWVSFDGTPVPTAPTINMISGSREGLTLKITLHGMLVEDTTVNGVAYQIISIPECAQISDIGKPMLAFISKMIAIHPQRQVRLTADSLEYISLQNYFVFPAQYSQNDSVYQAFPFVLDETLYAQNTFYPGITSKYKRPAIFRDLRVANLSYFPVFFNPQTHQLKVLKKAILVANFKRVDSINTLPTWPTSVAPLYGNIYRSTILNYNTLGIPDEILWTRPRYLIISDGSFAEALDPFIFWKRKKGLEIFLETINNPEQRDTMYIKDLITFYYNNYNISYVLLVGDGYEPEQPGYPPLLPIPNGWDYYGYPGSYSISDYWYSTIAGDDDIADVALGRFSVWTNEQLNRVTEKLFSFERCPNENEWFIKRNVLVSHKEGWRQYHECKTESIVPIITLFGFQYYDDWGGYAWMSNEVVKSHINDPASPSTQKGSSLLNYRGHGLVKEWQDWCYVPPTSFTNDDIYSLTNFVSYNNAWLPIVFENCCCCGRIGRTSPLSDTTGHSECWFRHQKGGGVAALGAARPTATFHNHKFDTELYRVSFGPNPYRVTQELGWVINNAKVNMAEAYGWDGDALNIVRTNNLIGDPEIDIYTGWNGYMTVWHEGVTYSGPQEFIVDVYSEGVPLCDAIVCLYKEGDVFETRPTNTDGRALFFISPHPGTMHVTVTKHDFGPYEGTCLVMGEDAGSGGQSESISYPFSFKHASYSPRTRSVNISYQLPEASFVEIVVFDIMGRLVNVVEKGLRSKGLNCEVWNRQNESGRKVGKGIYFIRLNTAENVAIKKVVIY